MTSDEARDLVAIIAATWTRPPVSEATVYAYAFGLADLDHAAAKEAVRSLMQTSRFLPTIAEVRERAVEQRVALPSPEEAWGIVRRAIGALGMYRTPVFDCDEIQAAVNAIGWRSICTEDNEASTRARFCAAMESFSDRRREAEATGRYVAPDRQLPENTEPRSGQGDQLVRVTTGYGTSRPRLDELLAADAARTEQWQRQLAVACGEPAPVDDRAPAGVIDITPFLARFPSAREP